MSAQQQGPALGLTESPDTELAPRLVRSTLLQPLSRGNALEDATARIVQTLRLGIVAPGEALPTERDLATAFGVSRDTVREAIRELTEAGYLTSRRGRYGGTFVTDNPPAMPGSETTLDEFEDLLALRHVVECGAAELAAARTLTSETRDELWQHHLAVTQANDEAYRRADTLLHLRIAELSGSTSLVALVAEHRARVNALLDGLPILRRNVEHSNEQHEAIVRAILRGDSADARRATQEHLSGTESLLRGFFG